MTFRVVDLTGGRHRLTLWIGVTVWLVPSEEPGGVAVRLEALAGGIAAEGGASVVGMMAVADQNTDGSVDGGQLGQPGYSGSQWAWRHIGIKGDSPFAVELTVPPVIAV